MPGIIWFRPWCKSASISETLDRYSHVTADMQQRAAAHFDRLFGEDAEDEATGTE